MNYIDYINNHKENLRPRAVGFLMNKNEILLGKKKEGIGMNKWIGIGGKVDKNETYEQTLARELKEEINVDIDLTATKKIAEINYFFPENDIDKNWDQKVVFYEILSWEGDPEESEEILPVWFKKDDLPLDQMWSDYLLWFEMIFKENQELIRASICFDKNLEVAFYKFND